MNHTKPGQKKSTLLFFMSTLVPTSQMIQITNLTKRYDKTQALSDVTLTFKEETVTAIMGENGAGRSNL